MIHRLVSSVTSHMNDAFPELQRNPQRIAEIIEREEDSFLSTLGNGITRFDLAAAEAISVEIAKATNSKVVRVVSAPSPSAVAPSRQPPIK